MINLEYYTLVFLYSDLVTQSAFVDPNDYRKHTELIEIINTSLNDEVSNDT